MKVLQEDLTKTKVDPRKSPGVGVCKSKVNHNPTPRKFGVMIQEMAYNLFPLSRSIFSGCVS